MGLFDTNTSKSRSVTDIDTVNTVASEGAIAAGEGATINVLDAGAVAGALDIGSEAFGLSRDLSSEAFGLSRDLSSEAFDLAKSQSAVIQGALGDSFASALGFAERVISGYQDSIDRQMGSSINAITSLAEGRQQGEAALWARIAGWGLLAMVTIAAIVRFTK